MKFFDTPILLIIFNRPDTTIQVFEAIRLIKPKSLYIFADGPRIGRKFDKELCQQAREIIRKVDWDCKVYLNFNETNLGCGPGPTSAIDWFFHNEEQGIILEDDCVPSMDFFLFAEKMLVKYKDNTKVMHISGSNLSDVGNDGNSDYFYSKYPIPWGWATWKRAWNEFDFRLENWSSDEEHNLFLKDINLAETLFWKRLWQSIKKGRCKDVWDAQWIYACMRNKALAVTPTVNLIKNIGFGASATHHKKEQPYLNKEYKNLALTITPPPKITPNKLYDAYILKLLFTRPRLLKRIQIKFLHLFG